MLAIDSEAGDGYARFYSTVLKPYHYQKDAHDYVGSDTDNSIESINN